MKTKKRVIRYFFLGLLNTAIGYGVYEAFALTLFKDERLWIATLISGVVSVFTGYFIHSHYTWKERKLGKEQAFRFLIWNIITAVAIKPVLTSIFELMNFLYKFAHSIFEAMHIPFSYDFVKSTGVFVLITAVIMVINFLVYDRFVFGKKKEDKNGEKVEVESVRKSREEEKSKEKSE